jgi:uncharacterized RDD family membrane protein YckC
VQVGPTCVGVSRTRASVYVHGVAANAWMPRSDASECRNSCDAQVSTEPPPFGRPDAGSTPVFAPEMTYVSGRRYLAHAIDGVVLLAILLVLLLGAGAVSSILIVVVLVVWISGGHIVYFVATQRGSGRSPGKRIAGLRVVDQAGKPPTVQALWRRSLPLVIKYTYIVAWVAMMGSPYRQRLGDRWAQTYVIEG